jgi:hypothetical protein
MFVPVAGVAAFFGKTMGRDRPRKIILAGTVCSMRDAGTRDATNAIRCDDAVAQVAGAAGADLG